MKKLNFKLITILAGAFIAIAAFTSCASNKAVVTDDLSYSQLIQKGQDASANEDYQLANKYFIACIDIYGADLKCYVETRYELATNNLKQKKYQIAKTMFNEIIEIYDRPDATYQVQPKFKKLAKIQLDKITAIEEEQNKKAAKTK